MYDSTALAPPFLLNVALILLAAVAYGPIATRLRRDMPRQLVYGLMFGLLAAICMEVPFHLGEGAQADLRYSAVMLAGPFGGPLAVLLAGAIGAGYRLVLGGFGAEFGAGLVVATALLGLALHYLAGSLDSWRKATLAGVLLPVLILIPSLVPAAAVFSTDVLAGLAAAYLVCNVAATMLFSLLVTRDRQHRASQAALATSETRLRQIIDVSYDWFWITDADLRFTEFSAQIHNGLPFDRLIGKRRDELSPGPVSDEMRRHIDDMMNRRPFRNFQYAVAGGNGTVKHIQVSGVPTYDADGRFAGYVGSGRDITADVEKDAALRRAREEAEAANHAKSAFLANMSHEIRTPMTGMLGMLDLLDTTALDTEQRGYADKVRAASASLMAIVNDVLDLSKVEAGRMRIEAAPFDLRRMLHGACEAQAVAARAKGLAFQLYVDPALGATAVGDRHRIAQVVTNLLSNAVRFTETGGIAVTAAATAEGVEIAVTDTGTGIAAETAKRIFEPFEQADASTTRRYGGTGLGLAICKSLAECMGGAISLNSTPGAGSTFALTLPLAFAAAGAHEAAAAQAPATAPRVRARLLVAEDNDINALLLRTMLARRGHDVTIVGNGRLAVEAAAEGSYDVALLDMHMPELDGVEATRRIRALPGPRGRIPIFALTADALQQNRARYEGIGLTEFLTKPIDWDALDEAIARHVPFAANRLVA